MSTEKQKTVIINGHRYDAVTGLRLESNVEPQQPTPKIIPKKSPSKVTVKPSAPVPGKKPVAPRSSHAVHASEPQRSQTLNRRVARKTGKPAPARPTTGRSMDVSRSSKIARFAPAAEARVAAATNLHNSGPDQPHRAHPMARRATERPKATSHPHAHAVSRATIGAPVTSQEIKNAAITQALSAEQATPKVAKKGSRRSRNLIIALACAVVLIGAAYLTFTNLPVLSVSLASAQAGIKAGYPSYVPDGYRLEQPITFNEGEVVLKFLENGGGGGYTITQERSSWDSSAVLTNIVQKSVGDDYSTINNSGLTIYTYKGNAAWVNAGILYTVANNGNLSSQQVNDIAASL